MTFVSLVLRKIASREHFQLKPLFFFFFFGSAFIYSHFFALAQLSLSLSHFAFISHCVYMATFGSIVYVVPFFVSFIIYFNRHTMHILADTLTWHFYFILFAPVVSKRYKNVEERKQVCQFQKKQYQKKRKK